ncbi:hypothetical protein SAMN05192553_107114 [Cyclobacterium xiamenense]|uniref:Uncharacterized protein n=1 Tax=Cyclobacterium xiamenense TaxID=1297121 RepID=A0A1H7AV55_9BACT|nr:hypothetical protein [Cyclobacterium xiamenense]SEJ65730.1 hypothetical protein SAMN05192553_107114 [Cyclobacterium xiamenense]
MIHWIKGFLIGLSLILFFYEKEEDIRYFQPATIPIADSSRLITVSINDSLYRQEMTPKEGAAGIPLNYFMDLHTGVCYDNTCRPLKIRVYWNITGRYLGFELLDGEYLSKYDHEPFSTMEYEELHRLLADPFLPLGTYSLEDLVGHSETDAHSVDGVSGATAKDVLEYVVPGAAYTTHKLYHVVHGPVQQQVMELTEKQLDPYLFTEILQSTDQSDRTWALERLGLLTKLDDSVIDALMGILLEEEYFQSYLVLKSLTSEQLESEELQLQLFKLIGKVDHGIENLIFDQLAEAAHLNPAVVDHSLANLSQVNGPQLVKLLKLYTVHEVYNSAKLNEALGEMIPHENSFVERQVLQFLEKHGRSPE